MGVSQQISGSPQPRATAVAVTVDLMPHSQPCPLLWIAGYRSGKGLKRLLVQPPPPGWATSQTMRAFLVSEVIPVPAMWDLVSPNLLSLSFLEEHCIHSIGLCGLKPHSLIHAEIRRYGPSETTSSLVGEADMTPSIYSTGLSKCSVERQTKSQRENRS